MGFAGRLSYKQRAGSFNGDVTLTSALLDRVWAKPDQPLVELVRYADELPDRLWACYAWLALVSRSGDHSTISCAMN